MHVLSGEGCATVIDSLLAAPALEDPYQDSGESSASSCEALAAAPVRAVGGRGGVEGVEPSRQPGSERTRGSAGLALRCCSCSGCGSVLLFSVRMCAHKKDDCASSAGRRGWSCASRRVKCGSPNLRVCSKRYLSLCWASALACFPGGREKRLVCAGAWSAL